MVDAIACDVVGVGLALESPENGDRASSRGLVEALGLNMVFISFVVEACVLIIVSTWAAT